MTKTILAVTIITIMGIGGTAMASKQDGTGKGCPGYHGQQGRGQMMENLSEEDQAKIKELRQAYRDATQSLRSQKNSKRFALKSELAKENPDVQTALKLQAELSELKAQLAQERIKLIIEMKKINPNAGEGFMMGAGSGKGNGKGGGRGSGCGNRW